MHVWVGCAYIYLVDAGCWCILDSVLDRGVKCVDRVYLWCGSPGMRDRLYGTTVLLAGAAARGLPRRMRANSLQLLAVVCIYRIDNG